MEIEVSRRARRGLPDRSGTLVVLRDITARRQAETFRRVRAFVEANAGQPIRLPDVAAYAGLASSDRQRALAEDRTDQSGGDADAQ